MPESPRVPRRANCAGEQVVPGSIRPAGRRFSFTRTYPGNPGSKLNTEYAKKRRPPAPGRMRGIGLFLFVSARARGCRIRSILFPLLEQMLLVISVVFQKFAHKFLRRSQAEKRGFRLAPAACGGAPGYTTRRPVILHVNF
jgi:hypothetical protein